MLEKRIGEINALRNDRRALSSVDDEDDEERGTLALEA
jgi:hypothetical protein